MKIILSIFIFVITNIFASAQCIPDSSITHNDPGIYPDSATGLPHAFTGVPYSTVIHTNVFTDTTVGPLVATIDSIVIDDVTGLPPGFSYLCTPSNCSFTAGSNACILLQGPAPTAGMIGNYPLIVHTIVYYKIFGTPNFLLDNNDDYSITIESSTGISVNEKLTFGAGQNMPNPAKDYTLIPVTLLRNENVTFTLTDLIGQRIIDRTIFLQKGKTNIPVDLHNLQPGIYLYTVSNGKSTVAKRMIISRD